MQDDAIKARNIYDCVRNVCVQVLKLYQEGQHGALRELLAQRLEFGAWKAEAIDNRDESYRQHWEPGRCWCCQVQQHGILVDILNSLCST